ncbi:MAG: M14 family metallopeptidase [Gemmatimonadales bacterium]
MRALHAPRRTAPWWAVLALFALLPLHGVVAQRSTPYRTHAALSADLRALATAHSSGATLVTIATSPGGRAVQALRVGSGRDVDSRPALLVIANAHGPHLVGSEIAFASARRLLERAAGDTAVSRLIGRTTIWFIPRMNPDAAESMFGNLAWERTGNGLAADDDHDQATDEDAPDDLNGDGLITTMRIADSNGDWIVDSADARVMRRADGAKGEVGRWRVLIEGRDDDGDGRYNEDGAGGIDINRNFAHNYAHHGAESGLYPFSAPEARGLAEFTVAHPEIAAVYVLGPQDNTLKPWEFRAATGIAGAPTGTSAGGPLTSILRADEPTFADVSRRFQEVTGLSKGPTAASGAGDILSHFYYVFGRWSFGSRGWWVPDPPRDTTARAAAPAGARAAGTASSGDAAAEERAALRWYRSLGETGVPAFAPWTKVDIGGDSAEVGGFYPGALLNPPAGVPLDSTLAQQDRFIVELAGMLPHVALRDAKVESLGDGAWRVSVEVANDGLLATTTALSARLRTPRGLRLELDPKGATIVSGERIQVVGQVPGGGRSMRRSWTVAGSRGTTMTLTVDSPVTGSASQTITLR